MIVGDRAQRPSDPRAVEEHGQHGDQDGGHTGRGEVELRNVHPRVVGDPLDRLVLQTEIEAANVRPPHHLRQALDEEREPYRRHEQRDLRLIHERAQHDALDEKRQQHHHRERRREREPERKPRFLQAHEGERREEHQRALGEVEHPRRLVDQHEAERDQRIHDAAQQPADQDFEEE
jgi:hypothetical protein